MTAVGGLPDVVIGTHSAFCSGSKRLRLLKSVVYDTVVLDEAHCAAAPSVPHLLDRLHALSWCALTATKVREDQSCALERRIGGTVAEIDRRRLVREGHGPAPSATCSCPTTTRTGSRAPRATECPRDPPKQDTGAPLRPPSALRRRAQDDRLATTFCLTGRAPS